MFKRFASLRLTQFVLRCAAIAAAGSFLAATQARASLIGDTVTGQVLFPSVGSVFADLGSAVVGPGVEFTPTIDVDFAANTVTFAAVFNSSITFFVQSFNGLGFADLTHPFTAVGIDQATNVAGFGMSDLSLVGGEILVNLSGLTVNNAAFVGPPTEIVLDVETAASVPEPGTITLFGTTLLGLGWLARRHQARAA